MIEQAMKLAPDERAQLIAALAEPAADVPASSIVGMFSDEPEVIDEAMEHVVRLRNDWDVRPLP